MTSERRYVRMTPADGFSERGGMNGLAEHTGGEAVCEGISLCQYCRQNRA